MQLSEARVVEVKEVVVKTKADAPLSSFCYYGFEH